MCMYYLYRVFSPFPPAAHLGAPDHFAALSTESWDAGALTEGSTGSHRTGDLYVVQTEWELSQASRILALLCDKEVEK